MRAFAAVLLAASRLWGCEEEYSGQDPDAVSAHKGAEDFRAESDECFQEDCSDYHLGSLDAGNPADEARAFEFIHALHCMRYSHRTDRYTDSTGKITETTKKQIKDKATGIAKVSDEEKALMSCLIIKISRAGYDQSLVNLAKQCKLEGDSSRTGGAAAAKEMDAMFEECIQSNKDPAPEYAHDGTEVTEKNMMDLARAGHVSANTALPMAVKADTVGTNAHDATRAMTQWFNQAFMDEGLAVKMVESVPPDEQRALLDDLQKVFVEVRVAIKFLTRDLLRDAAKEVEIDAIGRIKTKSVTAEATGGALKSSDATSPDAGARAGHGVIALEVATQSVQNAVPDELDVTFIGEALAHASTGQGLAMHVDAAGVAARVDAATAHVEPRRAQLEPYSSSP